MKLKCSAQKYGVSRKYEMSFLVWFLFYMLFLLFLMLRKEKEKENNKYSL